MVNKSYTRLTPYHTRTPPPQSRSHTASRERSSTEGIHPRHSHSLISTRRPLILSKYQTPVDGSWPWKHPSTTSSVTDNNSDFSDTYSNSFSDTKSSTNTVDDNSYTYYDNYLLTLAIDLGERLLPAFETATGK